MTWAHHTVLNWVGRGLHCKDLPCCNSRDHVASQTPAGRSSLLSDLLYAFSRPSPSGGQTLALCHLAVHALPVQGDTAKTHSITAHTSEPPAQLPADLRTKACQQAHLLPTPAMAPHVCDLGQSSLLCTPWSPANTCLSLQPEHRVPPQGSPLLTTPISGS